MALIQSKHGTNSIYTSLLRLLYDGCTHAKHVGTQNHNRNACKCIPCLRFPTHVEKTDIAYAIPNGTLELKHRWLQPQINKNNDDIQLTTLSYLSGCFAVAQHMTHTLEYINIIIIIASVPGTSPIPCVCSTCPTIIKQSDK